MSAAKILRYASPQLMEQKSFWDINYKTELPVRLHPRRVFGTTPTTRGELQKTEFYASTELDPTTGVPTNYQDLILEEEFTYTRDSLGFALFRDMFIRWYDEDGVVAHTKGPLRKYYDSQERIAEGKRRRKNVVDEASNIIAAFLVSQGAGGQTALDEGRNFVKLHQTEISSFIDVSHQEILSGVSGDATTSWLDDDMSAFLGLPAGSVDARAFLLDFLNIWGV